MCSDKSDTRTRAHTCTHAEWMVIFIIPLFHAPNKLTHLQSSAGWAVGGFGSFWQQPPLPSSCLTCKPSPKGTPTPAAVMHVRYVSILSERLRGINVMQEDGLSPDNHSDDRVFPYLSTANISLSNSTALNQTLTRSRIHFSTSSLTYSLTHSCLPHFQLSGR